VSLHFDRYLAMSTYNHKKTAQLAHDLSEQLTSHGIDAWLEYGSALGAVRDGSIVNGDSDIDLAIWWKDWKKFKNIMVTERIRTNIPYVYDFRMYPEGEVLKVKVADSSTVLDVDKKGYTDTIYIDVYGMQECDGVKSSIITYNTTYPNHRSKLYYQKNLRRIKFEGFDFYVSKYVEKYLDYVYKNIDGTTWSTPVSREKLDNWEGAMPSYHEEDKVTGYVEGVFDLFHVGHLRLLERSSKLFNKVVAGIHSDKTVLRYKNEEPVIPYEHRVEIVRSCKFINDVIEAPLLGTNGINGVEFLNDNNLDYLVHGETNCGLLEEQYPEIAEEHRLFLFPETPDYHTADLKKSCIRV